MRKFLSTFKLLGAAVRPLWCALGCAAMALPMSSANATLGGDAASVNTDRVRMQVPAAVRTNGSLAGTYTIHEMTLPTGTVVRQYLSYSGVVFGVTWSGPFKPDLQQLLGRHFQTMLDRQAGDVHAGSPRVVQQWADLVVESGGRPRNFIGRAYLPSAIPPGAGAQDIQ